MKPATLVRIAPIAAVAVLGLVSCILAACAGSTEATRGANQAISNNDECTSEPCDSYGGYGGYGGYGYYGYGGY